jgi:predicted acylesterase/phospholipase RssA
MNITTNIISEQTIKDNEDTILDCIMEDNDTKNKPTSNIRKIVCSGGGTFGLIAYGALKQSCISGFWNIENIQSMYGTSIGAIITLLISLLHSNIQTSEASPLTWDLMDTYIISRPWQNVFKINLFSITSSIEKCGILDKAPVVEMFEPLFKMMELSKNITMVEHYNIFGIEMHFYTTDLDSMETVDICYKTHPSWSILDAIYASCSLPILFSPHKQEERTYFDGGLFCNYPLYFCIKDTENTDEILGFKSSASLLIPEKEESQSILFDYILSIFKNLTFKIKDYDTDYKIKYNFKIPCIQVSIYHIYLAIMQTEMRKQMIDEGVQYWNENYK